MTSLLWRLLGRLPIGWLQLKHDRARLVAAVGGVTFANVLIFMQLGFMAALFETSVLAHRAFDADAVVVSADFASMREANPFPRARMLQALGTAGVESATPLLVGTLTWLDPRNNDTTSFRVFGVVPGARVFREPDLQRRIAALSEPYTALVDRRTRDLDPALEPAVARGGTYRLEVQGRALKVRGAFSMGAAFDVDGTLIVGEQTFLALFPNRTAGTVSLALLSTAPDADVAAVTARATRRFAEADARAIPLAELIAAEQSYQARQTPIGFVFGFGVAIGVVVGLMMVFQVLSTDVQDHLSEYATLKAIGYPRSFFRGIIIEEALCLAVLGFVPGFAIASGLYRVAARATALPIAMTLARPFLVLGLTAGMCMLSGAIATRRLDAADPAELF